MPEISRFYGIVVAMFFNEQQHGGKPHFHATYAGHDVSIGIESLDILAGTFPTSGLRLLKEWANVHREELMDNWERARRGDRLARIEPLP